MIHWIFILIAFMVGVFGMAIFKMKPDEECRSCDMAYKDTIRRLEDQIHGLKSSKGKLGKELQNMTFRNAGYRAR